MTWHLRSIETAEPRAYRACLTSEGVDRTFAFRVELHRDVELVTWEPDFTEFEGPQRPGGEPLLAAILAFHKARELTVG